MRLYRTFDKKMKSVQYISCLVKKMTTKRFYFVEELKEIREGKEIWCTIWPCLGDTPIEIESVAMKQYQEIEKYHKQTEHTGNVTPYRPLPGTFLSHNPTRHLDIPEKNRQRIDKKPIRFVSYAVGEDGCYTDVDGGTGMKVHASFIPNNGMNVQFKFY